MQRLWDNIRARNLHRVTAGYAVVAWVLFQGAGLAFPAFDLPGWSLRFVAILLVAGLPVVWVALWLAYPENPASTAPKGTLHHTEWTMIALLGLVLAATLGELIYSQISLRPAAPAPAAGGPQYASIAVLAFDNMSGDPQNAFFSEGISEQILNDLAQVPGLRVAGRTSSFSFQKKNVEISDIGRALHVHTVLEGSVRREGDRVRITAQLVDSTTDFHIWSETYDRELADIFAVQDDIATKITEALRRRLLGMATQRAAEPVTRVQPRIDPAAYTDYLKGLYFLNKRSADAVNRAIGFFNQANGREPRFADAHANLGFAYVVLYSNAQRNDTLGSASREVAIALRLDPDNLNALIAKALIAFDSSDINGADEAYRKALALAPNSADVLDEYAFFMHSMGLQDVSVQYDERAAAIDPLSARIQSNVGLGLYNLGHKDEAIEAHKTALEFDPGFDVALFGLCQAYAGTGKVRGAEEILRSRLIAVDGENGRFAIQCEDLIAKAKEDHPALERIAQSMATAYASGRGSAFNVGMGFAQAGDIVTAMKWFETSYHAHDMQLYSASRFPDFPSKLATDPRWLALMKRPWFRQLDEIRARIIARGTSR